MAVREEESVSAGSRQESSWSRSLSLVAVGWGQAEQHPSSDPSAVAGHVALGSPTVEWSWSADFRGDLGQV